MKRYSVYYWDRRLSQAEAVGYLERAWAEIYELEFDGAFGAWRGIHLEIDADMVHITYDTMYGGAPLMISICRGTGVTRMGFPPEEYLRREEEEIERLRQLPPRRR
jgi:hypothetical protein